MNKVVLQNQDEKFPAPDGALVGGFLPEHRTLSLNLGRYEPITRIEAIHVSHCCVVSPLIARIIATAHSWLREKWLYTVVLFKELFFWQIVFSSAKIKCCQCY